MLTGYRRFLFILGLLVPALCSAQTQIGGGGSSSSSSTIGITGPPTNGLIGRYDIPSTDSAAALTDTSGQGNNGTGTDGTAPTIGTAAQGGGLICGGSGASKLPAALNSALSIVIYMTLSPPQAATFYAPVMGNGNHTTNNFAGILMPKGQSSNPASNANIVEGDAAGTLSAQMQQGFYGTGTLIWEMDTNDRFFFGVNEGGYNPLTPRSSSAGKQTVGFYQLCGNAAGDGGAVATRITGTIWNAYFYNRVLTAADRAAIVSWLNYYNTARGAPPTFTTSATGNALTCTCDSLSSGFGGIISWMGALTTNTTYGIYNESEASNQMNFYLTAPAYVNDYFYIPSATTNILIDWLGTNDISVGSRTAAQVVADTANFLRGRQQLGFKTILTSMIDRTGNSANKDALDALWLANWQTMGNVRYADLASDANLGADGANANAVFFQAANIHVTQTGEYNDVVPIMQYAINAATGNLTWPQATTYTTGAAAAVATTAGSESTNTITITFGATPANCQVGNLITLAGITPAGYNSTAANGAGLGGFLILTRSATQITAFDNTTGLGAITVQGTGVCPQEQDADVYAILGGAAAGPNHTLEPCEGRSGQPIYRMITNTNAAPWTISGFNSETINGGATFTTPVASATNHPVVQLKPIPNAYSSSGCTWQASLQ